MNDCSVAEKTVKILSDNDLKIAVAESLTGGMVAAEFVDVPGVSKVFIEGIVAYANEAKIARRFAKDNGLYGIRFLVYFYSKWVFSITSEPGIVVDPAYPPTYINVSSTN